MQSVRHSRRSPFSPLPSTVWSFFFFYLVSVKQLVTLFFWTPFAKPSFLPDQVRPHSALFRNSEQLSHAHSSPSRALVGWVTRCTAARSLSLASFRLSPPYRLPVVTMVLSLCLSPPDRFTYSPFSSLPSLPSLFVPRRWQLLRLERDGVRANAQGLRFPPSFPPGQISHAILRAFPAAARLQSVLTEGAQ